MTQIPTSPCRLASSHSEFKLFRVRFSLTLALLALIISTAHAQTSAGSCQVSTQPPLLRAEGLTEVLGDIFISCSGFASGAVTTGNPTNRVDASGFTSQPTLSVDSGSGLTPTGISASIDGKMVTFSGASLPASPSGSLTVRISGIRAAVNQLGASAQSIDVDLATPLQLSKTHVTVGTLASGLSVTLSDTGIACTGSAVPSTITITNLFAAGTALASTRVTEGFSTAFAAKVAGADSGTRFLINYTGFPAAAHVYLPDRVAGSDAARPSLGGDLSGSPTVGQYVPGSGTLLLARVVGADANGAGGAPVPALTGVSAVTLDSVTEVPLANGSGYAVYEVVDANPAIVENAQFPTFVGLPAGSPVAVAHESISLAPVSTVATATSADAIPRFAATTPGSDCILVGDCQSSYFPKLNVPSGPILLTAISGGPMISTPGYVPIQNVGGGTLIWNLAVNYVNGAGWIQLDQPSSTINNGSVRVFVQAQNLAAGTYQANIVVNAGQGGSQTIPVTLTVQPAPPTPTTPTVTISQIVNAASFAPSPLVPGSVATLQGSHLSGKIVSVAVGGQPATILFSSDSQINFQVPQGLASQSSANVIVTVDGVSSVAVSALLAPAYPAIFAHGIRNQDWTENTTSNPAAGNTVLQIFGTGIPNGATLSVQIGNQMNLAPLYAGGAPTVPGVQQVNVAVPGGLAAGNTQLVLCATVNGQPYCSTSYALAVY
jgi:uncharacterized protein (TIGR03437 family)